MNDDITTNCHFTSMADLQSRSPFVSLPSLDRCQVDAIEQHRQFTLRDDDARLQCFGLWDLKRACFESLVPKCVSVAVPTNSLMRSRRRLANRKRAPESGSWPNESVTSPQSPSKLFRISVGSLQTKIRVFAAILSMTPVPGIAARFEGCPHLQRRSTEDARHRTIRSQWNLIQLHARQRAR